MGYAMNSTARSHGHLLARRDTRDGLRQARSARRGAGFSGGVGPERLARRALPGAGSPRPDRPRQSGVSRAGMRPRRVCEFRRPSARRHHEGYRRSSRRQNPEGGRGRAVRNSPRRCDEPRSTAIPSRTRAEKKGLLAAAARSCLAAGLVGVHEMGMTAEAVSIYGRSTRRESFPSESPGISCRMIPGTLRFSMPARSRGRRRALQHRRRQILCGRLARRPQRRAPRRLFG